jgi:adenylosuccinate lyase
MSSSLLAVSPIDGRYQPQLSNLLNYFSEYALIRYRIHVEIEYFIALSEHGFFMLNESQKKKLRLMVNAFSVEQAEEVKQIEKTTNHDVKAVEYFIKNILDTLKLQKHKEWVHFGLTSQDINNTAIPLLWKDAVNDAYMPSLHEVITTLTTFAKEWASIPMLARTHGQAASPTRLGKELMVYVERLNNQIALYHQIPYAAKFGGATGNFNAHHVAYPKTDWKKFSNLFVNKQLGLKRMQTTTQIEHYDSLAAQFDTLKRINTILIDLSRDLWTYISMDYFKQKVRKNEVGSSAMPHKVNPIDFENAEGNLGMANAVLEHLAAKLPISRLQRDLTDSTVLRNVGVPVGHIIIALNSLEKGLSKLILHEEKMQADLENNWAVVAEAIQTILRRENYPNPYEALKDLTRGNNKIDKKVMHKFIDGLKVNATIKKELKAITPHNYTGVTADY